MQFCCLYYHLRFESRSRKLKVFEPFFKVRVHQSTYLTEPCRTLVVMMVISMDQYGEAQRRLLLLRSSSSAWCVSSLERLTVSLTFWFHNVHAHLRKCKGEGVKRVLIYCTYLLMKSEFLPRACRVTAGSSIAHHVMLIYQAATVHTCVQISRRRLHVTNWQTCWIC